TFRAFQDRPSHRYVLVERKPADRLARDCACPAQVVAQYGQGRGVRSLHQAKENIVEQGDLTFAEAMSVSQKQLCHLPQYLGPALWQSAIESTFELRDQSSRFRCGHCQLGP